MVLSYHLLGKSEDISNEKIIGPQRNELESVMLETVFLTLPSSAIGKR